ncbi:hypothetical protein Tco_1173992 [Tanacetum coccineum]
MFSNMKRVSEDILGDYSIVLDTMQVSAADRIEVFGEGLAVSTNEDHSSTALTRLILREKKLEKNARTRLVKDRFQICKPEGYDLICLGRNEDIA